MRISIGALEAIGTTVAIVDCAPKPSGAGRMIEDKVYTVSPNSVRVTLTYLSSVFEHETINLAASFGGQ